MCTKTTCIVSIKSKSDSAEHCDRGAWTTSILHNNVSTYLHRCAFNTICRNEKHNFLESSSMRDASQVHARLSVVAAESSGTHIINAKMTNRRSALSLSHDRPQRPDDAVFYFPKHHIIILYITIHQHPYRRGLS